MGVCCEASDVIIYVTQAKINYDELNFALNLLIGKENAKNFIKLNL